MATYTDAGGEPRTVRKSVTVQQIPDDQNDTPTFPSGSDARTVKENMRAGTNVGRPVKAMDADTADNSKLTYTLSDSDGNFEINPANGQLTTTRVLNSEGAAATEGEGPSHTVTVTATDPGGTDGTQSVIITVESVNEAPMVPTGSTRADYPEKLDADILDTVGTYTASDPETESGELTWSLAGSDKDDFHIGNQEGGALGTLAFREKPDFEKPVDSNRDNIYMVTVQVSDGNLTGTRAVVVTVTDVEENGEVTLSAVQPKVGIDLMASLTDPDDVTSTNSDGSIETGVTWEWWRTTATDISTSVPVFPDAGSEGARDGWEKIDDADADTYEPVSGDTSHGLAAVATYTDRRGPGNTMHKPSDNGVIQNTDNVAPMFKENDDEITETTRKVAEDAKPNAAGGNVGIPVLATDPNGSDLLTYTLSGPDMALFKIKSDDSTDDAMRGGQISLDANTELDYEDRTTYMVKVTAADPDGEMASVDVTIKVTGVDEAPKIIAGGLVVRGTSDINYAENGTGMVTTYSAAGPDAADATWSLSGADAGDLSISSAGVLTFMASPNYESPVDANTDNIYMVMVHANDGTTDAMKAVTVRVTNEEEMGEVTLWAGTDALTMAPRVGDTITGAVMDPDGGEMVESWQWAKTMTPAMMDSWMPITGATDAAYMVTADDTGYHLRVMATYTDAAGTDMAMEYSMPTMMVTVVVEMMGEVTLWAGDDALTMAPQVGDIITGAVMDPDGGVIGESWQWSRTTDTADMSSWMDIPGATDAAYTVTADDTGYHLRVMATYTDAVGTDTAMEYSMPTMMVTAVVEMMGVVTLWAGDDALTMAPQVGDIITGAVMDPDGGVIGESWQWSKTMDTADMSSWMDIQDATGAAYTVTAGDTGYYLRVMATYTDAVGTDTAMEYSMPTMMVTAVDETQPADFDPLAKYDADKSGGLEKDEVIQAINDYLFGVGADAISKDDVIETINLYLFG